MKTLFRYIIVLLIFCLASLGLYTLVQHNPSIASAIGSPAGAGREGFAPDGGGFEGRGQHRPPANLTAEQQQQLESGVRPEGFAPGGDFEGRGGRGGEGHIDIAFGLMGILRNLGIIAIVTAAIVAIRWMYRRLLGRRKARPAPA